MAVTSAATPFDPCAMLVRTLFPSVLLTMSAASALAQSAPASPSTPKPAVATAAPEFRNLRFDESWTQARTGRWDDQLKHLPLAGTHPVYLTLGGQLRWREEFVRAFNTTPVNDDHSQSRLLLSADVVAGNRRSWYGRAFGELRDAQSYGRTLPGGARPTDLDRSDAQNLFVEAGFAKSFVRVGRQEIALGRERLFGVPDWANTRRGSQGLRAQLIWNRFAVDVVDARPVAVRQLLSNRADSTARFQVLAFGSAPGAARLARGLPTVWQGYWYNQRVLTASANIRRVTSGTRLQWQFNDAARGHQRSIEFEGATQRGHNGTRDIDAWFWIAEAQYQLKKQRGAPSLALGVEEASGERSASPTSLEAFTVLYPAAHAHGGYADVIGRTNVRELHAIMTWAPVRSVELRGALYRFDRLRLDDGVYNKQNTMIRAAGGSTERHVADEFDLTSTWKATYHWRVIAGAALVTPGAFLRKTNGGAHTERWGFVGTAFTF